MAKPIFSYNNFIDLDATVLSGGDWLSTLPLANAKSRELAKVTRSVTDAAADTQFDADLGAARLVRTMGVFGLNLSLQGRIRVRGYTGASHTGEVFDTGTVNPFEIYPSGVLEAGHPASGGTTLALEDWTDGYPVGWSYALSTPVSPRYLWFEFTDTANADTFVEFGRPWISYGYQPSHGVSVGQRITYKTKTRVEETWGGAHVYGERPRRRVIDVGLDMFEEDESLVYLMELNRRLGTHGQCHYIGNPEDVEHMHRQSGLFTLESLKPLVFKRSLFNNQGYTLTEEL